MVHVTVPWEGETNKEVREVEREGRGEESREGTGPNTGEYHL